MGDMRALDRSGPTTVCFSATNRIPEVENMHPID